LGFFIKVISIKTGISGEENEVNTHVFGS